MARNPPPIPFEPDLEIQIEGRLDHRALVLADYETGKLMRMTLAV
jgi:hypothetical protein